MSNDVVDLGPESFPRIIHCSSPRTNLTGTTTETIMLSVTIPGGAMGKNGMLRFTTLWSWNNSAGSKTFRIKWGSTLLHGGSGTTVTTMEMIKHLRNVGAENSQITYTIPTIGAATSTAVTTVAIDTSQAFTIDFTGQLPLTSDNITLESALVELIPRR